VSQPYPPHTYPPAPPPPARPFRLGRFAAWTAAAAVVAFGIGGALGVALKDDSGGDPVACKAALAENYRAAMADPDGPTQPAPVACIGLDEGTLMRLTGEVVSEYLDSPEADEDLGRALESATAQP
jgi:hypothetical protein